MHVFLASVLAAAVGCHDNKVNHETVKVEGAVTIGGQPIPADAEANIMFVPTAVGQANSSSVSIVGGKYSAEGVPKGKVLVTFTIMQPSGEEKPFAPGARPQKEMKSLVPANKVNGVEVQLAENNPNLNFDL